ncbi:hypothetical protein D0Z07_1013 [Hyphodiscus hymeniophilus]|uniref:Pre-rRNA processing protein n=1 Tax=Hyphodiscus hymeniophilus TaxID=353542 RepID=A0A9P6VR15_9HELO|nr:hypothetical protein D0Z07_1013 [Hyphodiscus hymeniophilus]
MSDDHASSPLLGERATSRHSNRSDESHEDTPLLSRSDDAPRYDGAEEDEGERIPSPAAFSLRTLQTQRRGSTISTKGNRRWPTVAAIIVLGVVAIGIIIAAFFAPAIVEEYAKESLVIEPTNLSIHNFTSTGVVARVQANFRMDASRVKNNAVRNLGRFGTWMAREVESKESRVEVYLPEYDNVLIGTADVPPIVVNIRNGHTTGIDFLTALEPGDVDGIRRVANDWLEGRLDQVRVMGKADVGLKSGLFSLGSQTITESLVFEGHSLYHSFASLYLGENTIVMANADVYAGNDIPSIPAYNITRLNFRDVPVSPSGLRGMAADVSLSLVNNFPIRLVIPPMSFDILVPNCGLDQDFIRLADATTDVIDVQPYSDVKVDVGGIVRDLPKMLIKTCPHSDSSPLDLLLSDYIHGNDTTMFVRGSSMPSPETPQWISALAASITVPVPFPGKTFDKLIRNFSLTDTKFSLPNPLVDPGSDAANPQISGTIVVEAGLPKEMNFAINVTRVRANATVSYKGDELGVLNLRKWQFADSERIEAKDGEEAGLRIKSRIEDAPLNITDNDIFTDVLQSILFGEAVNLKIIAVVDVEVSTVLGKFVIKDLPAEGVVPVKRCSDLKPKVGNLRVLSTGKTSINLQALVNFTNPTEYTAEVPNFNLHILNNGSIIGDATAKNIFVRTGNNTNILIEATWDPTGFGGEKAAKIGRELLSHKFKIEIPTPRLSTPSTGNGDDDDDDDEDDHKPHFIEDATFHLFSSTAQFTLISPLQYTSIYIETINATAFYNHTEPVGRIDYDYPFKVPPGSSQTPKLPVEWSIDSVGYEALQNALGGTLKLDAKGTVGVRLGQWSETVWYVGSGIGATVRL